MCHRCGWHFPNSHSSAKWKRTHKKMCETIEGYPNLIDLEVIPNDVDHLDDTKDKITSKISFLFDKTY